DLTTKYEELVSRGGARRSSPEMQSGGIAAVSNFGTFGVEWGTPIPLPDQTMILGLGVGKKTLRWDESKSEFVPITEAQITLSFDHRSIDGGGAGRLLKGVIELLEEATKLLFQLLGSEDSDRAVFGVSTQHSSRIFPHSERWQ